MKALDLFCGAGGASMGLKYAGFDKVVGVDIIPQAEYPFDFHCADILNMEYELNVRLEYFFEDYDLIWASPPCQAYSFASRHHRNRGKKYPDLICQVRDLLLLSGKPFVIENVNGSPLRKDLLLCGEMFGLGVIRHRVFEINGFSVIQLRHKRHKGYVKDGFYVTVAGNGGNNNGHNYSRLNGLSKMTKLQIWQHAMGIKWIHDIKMLAQAVPPAYAKYIGESFINSQIRPQRKRR